MPSHSAAVSAKRLRAEMSIPERILWRRLRGSQVAGLRFRRQHPIGPFIADLYCHAAALVIEIDGKWTHGRGTPRDDRGRDAWMRERGLEVLHIPASSVNAGADGVVRQIDRAARRRIEQLGCAGRIEAE